MILPRRIRSKLARFLSKMRVKYYRFMGIEIGDRVFISTGAHLDTRRGELSIGNHVDIAHGTYILSHTGFRPSKPGEKTILEDGVKIYVGAIILPGVRIGMNSIIGAGAVVMKDIPPNVIVMGNPARVIQQRDS